MPGSLLGAVTTLLARGLAGAPVVSHARLDGRATRRALLLVLLLVPVLMGPPYATSAATDADGNRYYRAYFTADFLWHSALAYELGKFSLPPRNPYLAPRAMNYYWTYFLLPASVARARATTAWRRRASACLKANAMLAGLLMVGALFLLVANGVASPWPAAARRRRSPSLAASAEGIYAIVDLLRRAGRSRICSTRTSMRSRRGRFGGLRIDNIPRSLWYTPQHTTSVALGLIGLLVASAGGVSAPSAGDRRRRPRARPRRRRMNPLLGGVCSMIYGVVHRGRRVCTTRSGGASPSTRSPRCRSCWPSRGDAASHVMDGAGSALEFGFHGFSRHSPVVTLLLSLGPILVPALAGLSTARGATGRPLDHRPQPASRRAVPALLRPDLRSFVGRVPGRADPARLDPDPARAHARTIRPRARRPSLAALILLVGAARPPSSTPGTRRTSATAARAAASAGRSGRRPPAARRFAGFAQHTPSDRDRADGTDGPRRASTGR